MTIADPSGRSHAQRVSLFYAASFVPIGLYLPFFPVVLAGRGLTEAQIGMIMATPLLVRVPVSPVTAYLADRHDSHRLILLAAAAGVFLSFIVLDFAAGFAAILAAAFLLSLFWVNLMPLIDTIALAGVRRHGLDYGRMRLWGSITFILASIAGGQAVGLLGPEAALWMMTAAAGVTVIAAWGMPRPEARTPGAPVRPAEALQLLRSPSFLLLVATTSLVNGSHAIMYTFGSLHWQSLGHSPPLIGALWAVAVLAEIVLFAISGRVLAGVAAQTMLLIAAAAGVARWLLTSLDPPALLLFPIQALHGLTFGAMHLGSMQLLATLVSPRIAGSAQGLHAAIMAGLTMGVAILASGPLYAALAGHAYWVMAGLSGLAVATSLMLAARLATQSP
jgi:PPP family 3-phenylpropionic acid transporter